MLNYWHREHCYGVDFKSHCVNIHVGLCLRLFLMKMSGQTNMDKGSLVEMKLIISCFVWAWVLKMYE